MSLVVCAALAAGVYRCGLDRSWNTAWISSLPAVRLVSFNIYSELTWLLWS